MPARPTCCRRSATACSTRCSTSCRWAPRWMRRGDADDAAPRFPLGRRRAGRARPDRRRAPHPDPHFRRQRRPRSRSCATPPRECRALCAAQAAEDGVHGLFRDRVPRDLPIGDRDLGAGGDPRGQPDRQGPRARAWSQARIITPMIFRPETRRQAPLQTRRAGRSQDTLGVTTGAETEFTQGGLGCSGWNAGRAMRPCRGPAAGNAASVYNVPEES
jgi:hypothetical protein